MKNANGSLTTSTYDEADQLSTNQDSGGTTTYTFDANGNQQVALDPAGDRTTWTWDFDNQNTLVQIPDNTIVEMTYNADNRRVKKVGNKKQNFVWDVLSDNVLMDKRMVTRSRRVEGGFIRRKTLTVVSAKETRNRLEPGTS